MTTQHFNLDIVDPSWRPCIQAALKKIDPLYLQALQANPNYLPGPQKIFSAFKLPVSKVNYVLFGESPYPRAESANGHAFWDQAVTQLWSENGMSKRVNRATSLRHIMKMLLVAEGLLDDTDTSQPAIAQLDKQHLINMNDELFGNIISKGFLLLNATPVLAGKPQHDAAAWFPFVTEILGFLTTQRPNVTFILFGNIAKKIDKLIKHLPVRKIYSEHPYNQTFIHNPVILDFFRPFNLLRKNI